MAEQVKTMESVRKSEASIREIAEHFGVHINTIHKMIHSGRLKAFRLCGRGPWYVPWSEVERAKQWYKPDTETAL